MVSSNKSNSSKLLDPKNKQFKGQERVNAEIFTAMEILGRKLERSESEKYILEKRLALIESAATIDEKTGKIYLPALIPSNISKNNAINSQSKWMVMTSFVSVSIALLSLALVFFKEPIPSQPIVREQITFNKNHGWKNLKDISNKKDFFAKADNKKEYKIKTNISEVFKNNSNFSNKKHKIYERKISGNNFSAKINTYKSPEAINYPVINIAATKKEPVIKYPEKKIKNIIKQIAEGNAPAKPIIKVKIAPKKIVKKQIKKTTISKKISSITDGSNKKLSSVNNALYRPKELLSDKSLPKNLRRIEDRAYKGIAEAQHDIGIAYASGKDIPLNYKRSLYWLEKAANNGIANANYNLAVMYQQGLGVKKNLSKAIYWYKNAAELGHPEAMYNLGISYVEGMGVKPQISRSISYFKRAAKAGITQAAYNLGVIFEGNMSGEINIAKSIKWYQMAADKGNVKAAESIARIKSEATKKLTLAERIEPAAGN